MHSWLFRHRDRLAAAYAGRGAVLPDDSCAAARAEGSGARASCDAATMPEPLAILAPLPNAGRARLGEGRDGPGAGARRRGPRD